MVIESNHELREYTPQPKEFIQTITLNIAGGRGCANACGASAYFERASQATRSGPVSDLKLALSRITAGYYCLISIGRIYSYANYP